MVSFLMRRGVLLRMAALALMLVLPSALLVRARLFDPRDYYADQGVTGPFEAVPDGEAVDGQPRFKPGLPLAVVRPGQQFVWVSSLCLDRNQYMLGHVELVRRRDGMVVAHSRVVLWTPEMRRCGPAAGSMVAPADADGGDYELQRIGTLRPLSWWPLQAPLAGLRFPIAPP